MIVAGLLLSGGVSVILGTVVGTAPMLALRVVQGACAAMILPSALSYNATRIRPEARVLMISCVTTSAFAAAIVMQAVAQLLVGSLGWRGVFVLSGVALIALSVLARFLLLPIQGGNSQRIGTAFSTITRLLARALPD